MRRAPLFWNGNGIASRLLTPASMIVAAITARRVRQPGWRAPVPVICCGNVTVGGSGKTTVVLDLANRLQARGVSVHVLLRGYGGSLAGPARVLPDHTARLVGDEALLLSQVAPTWVGGDRAASARLALAAGAGALILDDGLQNATLEKTLSLLVVDGRTGFGNGRVLPAGPLREPVRAGAARCRAVVMIGADTSGASAALGPGRPILNAELRADENMRSLSGTRVLAFAGIGHPEKFFASLERAGAVLRDRIGFPDHYFYMETELANLIDRARQLDAIAVTTPKDAVRIIGPYRTEIRSAGVTLAWRDPAAIERILDEAIG